MLRYYCPYFLTDSNGIYHNNNCNYHNNNDNVAASKECKAYDDIYDDYLDIDE
jgi:hypothetical protein